MTHWLGAPLAVKVAPPKQRGSYDVVAIAENVGPHLDPFADNALYGKASAVDDREDVLNVKNAACYDVLSHSFRFIHG